MERASKTTILRLLTLASAFWLAAAGAAGCSSSTSKTPADAAADTLATDGSKQDAAPADLATADHPPDVPPADGAGGDGAPADHAAADAPSDHGTAADAPADQAAGDAPASDAAADAKADTGATDASGSGSDGAAPDATTSMATGLVNPRTVPVGPSTPLAVATGAMLPTAGATGVPADTLLRIGFDAAPTLGTAGTIAIHQVSDGTVVDSINLADPYAIYDGTPAKLTTNLTSTKLNIVGGIATGIDQVRLVNYVPIAVSGNTATIIPHNNKLAYNTGYYVTIDAGVLTGTIASAAFGGISDATTWTFTTKAAKPATLNVAADNSADFATVQGAIDAIAPKSNAALTISIAPGVYQEMLFIRSKTNITFQGSNNGLDTVIQFDNSDGFNPGTGGGQTLTAGALPAGNLTGGGRAVLLTSSATGIVLDSITIMNLHPQGSRVLPTVPATPAVAAGATTSPTYVNYNSAITQAETIYFNTTFSTTAGPGSTPGAGTLVAKHSNFISYQDTLQLKGFSWFYDCFVTGDTDFIWGNANTALFERSEIKSRFNSNGSSVVQSRAYLGSGTASTPASFTTSYGGFVFLNSALTKEAGTFTAYLARSPGAATVSGTAAPFLYLQYDIVSYINCTMDTHIAAVGWNVSGSNPPGANVRPNPVTGWREYNSMTPAGQPLDVSARLVDPAPAGTTANPGGSLQLTAGNAATFFPNRATILEGGATDGTYTTTGLANFSPTP